MILLVSLALLTGAGCANQTETEDLEAAVHEAGFAERRAILLEQVAERYRPTAWHDRGKYTFPKTMARMALYGEEDEQAKAYLREYSGDKYEFFHFPFVGLARLFGLHAQAPVIVELKEEFLGRILNYDPQYHYNALTGEGTENHVAMSRTSGYLFAEAAMKYPGLRGKAEEWKQLLKPWILEWGRRCYAVGTGEWDSSVYTAYNLVGWLNLYDFAEDPEVKAAARAVVDYYAATIALKFTDGIYGGAESRGATRYDQSPQTATGYIGWLWFGTELPGGALPDSFFSRSEYIQAVHAATSRYRPHPALVALARKQPGTLVMPAEYRLAKPDYLMLEAGRIGEEIFRIEKTYTAGTAQTRIGGWSNASYGLINWKVVLRDPSGEPSVLWGNGGMKSTRHARGRNPWDQFAQTGPVIIQMTRVPQDAGAQAEQMALLVDAWREAHDADFQKRWGRRHMEYPDHVMDSALGKVEDASQSFVLSADSALPFKPVLDRMDCAYMVHGANLVIAHALSGGYIEFTDAGTIFDRAEPGRACGFILEIISFDQDPGTPVDLAVKQAIAGSDLSYDADTSRWTYTDTAGRLISFAYGDVGDWEEMMFDWGWGIQQQQIGFNNAELKHPGWPTGEGQGRMLDLWVDGVQQDRLPASVLIDGPNLRLADGVLEVIREGKTVYRVDFSGEYPLFN